MGWDRPVAGVSPRAGGPALQIGLAGALAAPGGREPAMGGAGGRPGPDGGGGKDSALAADPGDPPCRVPCAARRRANRSPAQSACAHAGGRRVAGCRGGEDGAEDGGRLRGVGGGGEAAGWGRPGRGGGEPGVVRGRRSHRGPRGGIRRNRGRNAGSRPDGPAGGQN